MSDLEELLSGAELRPNKSNNDEQQRELTYAESHRAAILNEIEKETPYDAEEVLKHFGDDIDNVPQKDGHADIEQIVHCIDTDTRLGISEIKSGDEPQKE